MGIDALAYEADIGLKRDVARDAAVGILESVLRAPNVGTPAGDAIFAAHLVVDKRAGFGVNAHICVGIEDSMLCEG